MREERFGSSERAGLAGCGPPDGQVVAIFLGDERLTDGVVLLEDAVRLRNQADETGGEEAIAWFTRSPR